MFNEYQGRELQLLDAELEATETGQARAALLYERALVLDERLDRHEEAARAFREVVECVRPRPEKYQERVVRSRRRLGGD